MAVLLKVLILCSIQILKVEGVSKKKGIVHMVGDWKCGDDLALDNVEWWYDYSPTRTFFNRRSDCSPFKTSQKYNDSFAIMAWGPKSNLVTIDNEKYCMGYNEPNQLTQANMTAEEAAAHWPYIEQNCKLAKLVSPSAVNCGVGKCNDYPFDWFDKFFSYCKDCRVDYLATHTFMCDPNILMDYLQKLYDRYGRQIWLTEFSCGKEDNADILAIFMKQILPKLEASPIVYRYAWYKARVTSDHYITKASSLLKQDSPELTRLGMIYNDYDGGPEVFEPMMSDDAVAGMVDEIVEENKRLEGILGAGKAEAMILSQAVTDYYTYWYTIFNAINQQLGRLPSEVAAFYMSAAKTDEKIRIKSVVQKIICTEADVINDADISAEAERIRNLRVGEKVAYTLKRPDC